MTKQETTNELPYQSEYKGFRFAPLTDGEREILDNPESNLDYTFAIHALAGSAELGYKFTVKPIDSGWYAADLMMTDVKHKAFGWMIRAENDSIERVCYSLYMKAKRVGWDISQFPEVKKKSGRIPR